MNSGDLLIENIRLKAEVESLRKEVATLTQKLAFAGAHNTLVKGMQGESLIAEWVNGVLTTHNASHDLVLGEGVMKIEIKYSGLNSAIRSQQKPGRETLRWAWAKPFGESGNKIYDQLILIGDKDARYSERYQDQASPYVFFDVPYRDIFPLTIQTNGGRYRSIQLTTNPRKAKSSASALFQQYQVTLKELESRYRL
jgi:hypothetical protein